MTRPFAAGVATGIGSVIALVAAAAAALELRALADRERLLADRARNHY